jgi:hypothetical protein
MQPFTICPECGCKFSDIRVYTLPQLSSELGVKPATIRDWMRSGELKFKLWARGRSSVKVIFISRDVVKFLGRKFGDPERRDGSLALRLWDWRQRNGRLGGLASGAARRAKRNAPKSALNGLGESHE